MLKVFAGRAKDWVDVGGILIRSGSGLDWVYLLAELTALCELLGDTTGLPRLAELRNRLIADGGRDS